MDEEKIYDAAIVGGGLAGLSLSILLSREGYDVILFEKESYPFHKVCGEYISAESRPFLKSLGLPLDTMDLPAITKLIVTSPGGYQLNQNLPLGGFGISRYKIDHALRDIASGYRVRVMESCKVENVSFSHETFYIHTPKGTFKSRICCGAFGKRSNLDVKWNR
ncbi:MAG TPA: NAD(P)-binding protein, partial [Ferruginibacter sp.]|nr:NAD(P)-binding protein [Ferruginibacter sp.]